MLPRTDRRSPETEWPLLLHPDRNFLLLTSSPNVLKWEILQAGTARKGVAPILVARILDGTQKAGPGLLNFLTDPKR